MKRTNLIKNSVKLLMSIIIASSVVAMGSNGTVAATLTNNDAIISNIVMAAETTPLPKQWSTAEVYKDARYGETWSGEMAGGSYVSWNWLNDQSYVFSTENVTTNNGTNLNFQWLIPVDMTQSGSHDTYYSHTDNNEPIRKEFQIWREQCTIGTHIWEEEGFSKIIESCTHKQRIELGSQRMEIIDEGDYYRVTFNITDTYLDGSVYKGYITFTEIKETGEVYGFKYKERNEYFDDTRALTVIYSCLPTIRK